MIGVVRVKANKGDITVHKRKVFKSGGSLAVTLPQKFVELHDIRVGDELPVIATNSLRIIPVKGE